MKRLLVLAVLVLAVLGLVGCAPGDEAVLTVNGDEVLSADQLQSELDQLADAEDALTAFDGRGTGSETLSAGFVASVLGNHVLTRLIEADLAAVGVETTEEDIATGTEQLRQLLGPQAQAQERTPIELEDIPSGYRGTLVDLFAHATALRRHLGDDDDALQARINELLADTDVDVADRYGRWDPTQAAVVPPEGPATPTPLATVPAG